MPYLMASLKFTPV